MKKTLLLTMLLCVGYLINAQVSKTLAITTAGTLTTLLTASEKTTVTNLTVTGNIDARDVKCMRDEMTVLAVVDLGGANIVAYSGSQGTKLSSGYYYLANEMPSYSFYTYNRPKEIGKLTLKSITLPNTITKIDAYAFCDCSGLTSITLPNALITIDEGAFGGCTGLISITLPNTLRTIGAVAFSGCSGLTSISLPNALTTIDKYAFEYCSGLKNSITLPNKLTTISAGIFCNCSGLTSISLPNALTTIGIQAFYNCSGLTSITLPNTLTTIGNQAFFNCSGLTSITLPNTLTTIGDGTFSKCSGITSITLPNTLTTISDGTFSNCSGITSITLPNTLTTIGDGTFSNCSGLTNITLPNSLTTIGAGAFYKCSGIISITLPSSVTAIGNGAFSDGINFITCMGNTPATSRGITVDDHIIAVYVPSSAIATYEANSGWMYYNIVSVKHVTINNITAGGLAAAIINDGFGPLDSITHLTVTGNINAIDISQMKKNMSNLTAIDLSGAALENNTLPDNAFENKIMLTSVVLPATVVTIGKRAFSGCRNLQGTMVPLPALVKASGSSAYLKNASLSGSLTIPASVTSIGDYAFYDCSGFKGSLTLPNAQTSIGSFAFYGCSGLTGKLTIPLAVAKIDDNTFKSCKGITELTISKNTGVINDNAFSDCTGLQKITVPCQTPPSIYMNTFYAVNKEVCELIVPIGSAATYKADPYWGLFKIITEAELSVPTVLINIANSLITVYTTDQSIVVVGTAQGQAVAVYNTNGALLQSVVSVGDKLTIPVKAGAVYLVKVGVQTFKLVL